MARAKSPAGPAPDKVSAGGRVLTFVGYAVAGVLIVGVADYLQPMSQPVVSALCVGVVAAAAVFAATRPWRYALAVAVTVGLAAGGVTYSPDAQHRVEAGWAKTAHGIDKLLHHGDGSARAAGR